MKKILISLAIIGIVAGATLGITGAWWSDQATSANASFNSGNVDLKLWGDQQNGAGGVNWWDNVKQTWDTENMSPGGKVLSATLPMKNFGTINSDHMDFAIANTSSEAGMDKFMRITKLTYDGKSLLEGGAGAVIPDYVAPMNCNLSVNMPGVAGSVPKITTAIANATSGETICVGPGNYTSTWEGSSPIIVGTSVTIVSTEGPSKTSSIPFQITADDVTIKGFSITNPGNDYGILVKGKNGAQILDNNIHDIGTLLSSGTAQAVYLEGETGVNGFTVKNNTITNVGNLNLVYGTSGSAKGIYIGDSTKAGTVSNVVIENNIISDIKAATVAWNAGRGAYGILIGYGRGMNGGITSSPVIKNNTITDLEGLWSHAISLESRTPGASVVLNDISNLAGHKIPADEIGVRIEDNPASGIVINQNNFTPNVAFGVVDVYLGGSVDVTNNWWGDFDPSDQVASIGPVITTSPYANGPFVGFINGVDTIANGFADLRDFQTQGIKNVKPGLSNAHERKDLVMDVQLDASTPNQYQGKKVEMTMTVTMQQGPTQ